MFKRILVPVDDSSTSRQALVEAARFVQDQHAVMRLVHVIDLAQFSWGGAEFVDVGSLQDGLRKSGGKVLEDAQGQLAASGITAEASLLEIWGGQLFQALLDDAKSWQADIVVMGTHGWTGLDHLLMGSVAEGVVRHAHVPVLLIRTQR